MRRARLVPRLSLALLLMACGGSSNSATPPASPAIAMPDKPALAAPGVAPPSAEALARLARSSNAFGFDLYRRVRLQPGNLILSPASLTTALTMTWGGARGETAEQMRKVLHLEGSPDEVRATAGRLTRSLEDPSRPVIFRIANQLFAEKTYQLQKAFVDATRAAYGAPLELVDFKRASEPARMRINEWVEGKTEKRIQDLIPPRGVDGETRLVLVNAIYFLGDWEEPFLRESTRPAPFRLSASTVKDVPTMNRTAGFRIAAREGVTALELPYKGGAMSMLLLVPDAIDGLPALEASLDEARVTGLVGALRSERVWVALPKMEIRPAASLALKEELRALGMPLAFDRGKADFRGIADPPDPADRPVIGEVFHKGFVKVDEKGTEAAAATAVVMQRAGAAYSPPRELKVDRPFLFLIRDNASGLVLFLGRVTDPTAS